MSARRHYVGTAPDGSCVLFRSRRERSKLKRHPKVKRLALSGLDIVRAPRAGGAA